jgi:Archaeal fructose-1,6-bisphosphatase and related enzymes of inositol monophosphatase family
LVNNKELFSFSTKLVEKSRKIILPLFRSNLNINSKDDYTPVTEADRKTEVALRKIISKNYPEHGIHGEEYPPN